MVIAMVGVRVVKVAINQKVRVIAMGNRLVAAARAMHVLGIVSQAAMVRRAPVGIGC